MRQHILSFLCRYRVPIVLYLSYDVLLFFLGPEMELHPGWWYFLPLEALREQPFMSFLLLHSQPPIHNFLFYLCYLGQWTIGIPPAMTATIFFQAFGLLACLAWFRVAWWATGSKWVAGVILFLLLLNPAWYNYQTFMLYTHLVLAELGLFSWMTVRWIEKPSHRRLAAVVLAYAVLLYTRTIWHWLFGIGAFGLLGWHVWMTTKSWRAAAKTAAFGAVLLMAIAAPWMIKNKILFHSTSFSSWLGANLTYTNESSIRRFGTFGDVDEEVIHHYYTPERIAWFQNYPAVAMREKNTGSSHRIQRTNYNWYGIPAMSAEDVRMLKKYYSENPGIYYKRVRWHMICFDTPSFDDALSGVRRHALPLVGRDVEAGTVRSEPKLKTFWLWSWDVFYHGSWFKIPNVWTQYRPSLFAVLLLASIIFSAWRFIRSPCDPRCWFAGLLVAMYAWFLAMVLLIDGTESARMRWPMEPIYLIMLAMMIQRFCGWIMRKHHEGLAKIEAKKRQTPD